MNKRKVLILGGTGMLGWVTSKYLGQQKQFNVTATYCAQNTVKIANVTMIPFNALEDSISLVKDYEIIINCIGKIRQKISTDNLKSCEEAISLNGLFPFRLSQVCKEHNIECFTIATDCVFAGDTGNYDENSPHNPTDIYGQTKSLGEVQAPNSFHLRCSIIGPELTKHSYSLLGWLLSNKPNSTVSGYTDHFWNGVTTLHFAKVITGAINNDIRWTGTPHLVPRNTITKHALLKEFTQVFHRNDIQVNDIATGSVYNHILKTIHPEMNEKLWQAAGYASPPTIELMVKELQEFLTASD